VEIILQLTPLAIISVLVLFCSLVILLQLDFLNYFLLYIIPGEFLLRNIFVTFLRAGYFYWICKIVFVSMIVLLELCIIGGYVFFCMFYSLRHWSQKSTLNSFLSAFFKVDAAKKMNTTDALRFTLYVKLLHVHSCIKIIEIVANEVIWLLLPQLLLLGGMLVIFSNYGMIRMSNVVPMPFYLGFPLLSCLTCCILFFLLPIACNINEHSSDFLCKMKPMVYKNKYLYRKIVAQQSCRLSVARMFHLKKSSLATICMVLFDYTTNLLLLY